MPDIQILKEMIREDATVATAVEYERNFIELHEPQAAHPPVRISGLPDNVIIVKADLFRAHHTFFPGKKANASWPTILLLPMTAKKRELFLLN